MQGAISTRESEGNESDATGRRVEAIGSPDRYFILMSPAVLLSVFIESFEAEAFTGIL